MSEHIDIFETIFRIKDHISDNDFLELNNQIQKLIQENMQLKNENKNLRNEIPEQDEDSEEEEEYIEDSSSEEIEVEIEVEVEEEVEILPCNCLNNWKFPDVLIPQFNQCFCLTSDETLKNCENFKKLMEQFPLIENLFHKIDLPFVEEPSDGECERGNFINFTRILLSLFEQSRGKKKKTILTFVVYDFMIKNIKFLKDNSRYAEVVLKKLKNEFMADPEYFVIAQEYNVNINKWLEIIQNTIAIA